MKPSHVDKSSNRTKQRLYYWQSIHQSVNITKIWNFFGSFPLNFLLFNQGSLIQKVFHVVLVIKTKSSHWNHVTNKSTTYCKLYELFFLYATTDSLIKLIFCMKNKKAVDLKLQHRISKQNSFSKHICMVLLTGYLRYKTTFCHKVALVG